MLGEMFGGGLTIGNVIDNALEALFKKLGHKMTYAEYLDITSEYIDERILEECRGKSVTCYGGKAKFNIKTLYNKSRESAEFVIIQVELYYKDLTEKWIKTEFSGKTPISRFDFEDEDTVAKFNEITNNGFEEINIEPPKMK